MSLQRLDPDRRWSEAVIHHHTLYYTGVPDNLNDDAYLQTKNVLSSIDAVLARVGSDKSQIIDVTIFLADKADFQSMNKAWDEWVVPQQAPVRCTVHAGLMKDQYKVEIKMIAACE